MSKIKPNLPPKIKLNASYGFLTTPGNGKILNGTIGTVIKYSTTEKCDILFDGEIDTVKVPCHWITEVSDESN
jgi:hypothetical protein